MLYLLLYSFFNIQCTSVLSLLIKYYFPAYMHRYVWSDICWYFSKTQLKQSKLENQLHISTEKAKYSFNDTAFQHFIDELVTVFLSLNSVEVVVMLPFKMIFFMACFASFFSAWICNTLVPCSKQYLFKIFNKTFL